MKKIIFIVGAGRSGSTILDKTLGGHSKVFSLGEIGNLIKQYKQGNALCGCSVIMQDCEFWNPLLDDFSKIYNCDLREAPDYFMERLYTPKGFDKILNRLRSILLMKGWYHGFGPSKFKLEFFRNIYNCVLEKTNAEVLIDSSKAIGRALLLSEFLVDYESWFIFLVRDGRGVLHSMQKKYERLVIGDEVIIIPTEKIVPAEDCIRGWEITNKRILKLLKTFGQGRDISLKYEDFANDPVTELTRILERVGLNYESSMLNLSENVNHIVGSNLSKISAKEILPPSESWKTDLSADLLREFELTAGKLSRKLGYC